MENNDIELRRTRTGMGMTRKEDSAPEIIGRRKAIGIIGGMVALPILGKLFGVDKKVAETAGNITEAGGNIVEGVKDNVINPETGDQKKAQEIFEKATEHSLVTGLIVKGDGSDKFVNFRDQPRTHVDREENAGHNEGRLDKGTVVEGAIAVWGNDWKDPANSDKESVWLAFPKGDRIVFANADFFEHNNKLVQTQPYDLETGEPRGRN